MNYSLQRLRSVLLWGVPYAGSPSLAARIMLTNQVFILVLAAVLLYAGIFCAIGQVGEGLLALPFALAFSRACCATGSGGSTSPGSG
jgi:hypothetical protein